MNELYDRMISRLRRIGPLEILDSLSWLKGFTPSRSACSRFLALTAGLANMNYNSDIMS